jgi:hypothetical protein
MPSAMKFIRPEAATSQSRTFSMSASNAGLRFQSFREGISGIFRHDRVYCETGRGCYPQPLGNQTFPKMPVEVGTISRTSTA